MSTDRFIVTYYCHTEKKCVGTTPHRNIDFDSKCCAPLVLTFVKLKYKNKHSFLNVKETYCLQKGSAEHLNIQ